MSIMKTLFHIAVLSLTLVSCSKISQSDLQGSWTVDSIQQQEITADTDSGWKPMTVASSIFFVGEMLTFNKSTITPCPSAASSLKVYDNFTGTINYTLSGNKIFIPEQQYYYVRIEDNETSFYSSATYMALEFEVGLTGNEMDLIGKFEETDNLGNVKRRVNVMIDLSRAKQ